MSDTKRINGVTGATVGDDWINLHFEGYDILLDKLNISNRLLKQEQRRFREIQLKGEIHESRSKELYGQIDTQQSIISQQEIMIHQLRGALGYPVPGHIKDNPDIRNGLADAKEKELSQHTEDIEALKNALSHATLLLDKYETMLE